MKKAFWGLVAFVGIIAQVDLAFLGLETGGWYGVAGAIILVSVGLHLLRLAFLSGKTHTEARVLPFVPLPRELERSHLQ